MSPITIVCIVFFFLGLGQLGTKRHHHHRRFTHDDYQDYRAYRQPPHFYEQDDDYEAELNRVTFSYTLIFVALLGWALWLVHDLFPGSSSSAVP